MNNNAILYSQTGRSMIEMLGVLAIIGVLSIGGIAGYSKAMTKYRINKTADQVSQLAQNIRTLYASQKNYSTLSDSVIRKAHLAPEEMYEATNSNNLTNPFGGSVYVNYANKSYDNNKAFYITAYNIPQEACVELLTQDWGSGTSSGLIAVGSGDEVYTAYFAGSRCDYAGYNVNCADKGVMTVDRAISICSNPTNNHIGWKFY